VGTLSRAVAWRITNGWPAHGPVYASMQHSAQLIRLKRMLAPSQTYCMSCT